MHDRIRAIFEPDTMRPAAGQGALGIEIRTDRQDLADALAPLAHLPTWLRVAAERAVSRGMGGSCSVPLAAHAVLDGDVMRLDAAWGDPEGVQALVCVAHTATVTTLEQAEALGAVVAAQLQAGGAKLGMPS